MPAIVTITFSPCIDKSMTVASLLPDIKLKCTSPVTEPGGGGVNVARAIKKLGGEATAIYLAGGYTGQFFSTLLQREKIDTIVIETAQDTRENIILLETTTNRQYRLGMPCPPITQHESGQLIRQLEALNDIRFVVVSGSFPPELPEDIIPAMVSICKKKNVKLVADCAGKALNTLIAGEVFLIKPNLRELRQLTGQEINGPVQAMAAARQLLQQYPCTAIVVSMGSEGALLVTKQDELMVVPPEIERKSTVGAGDSMVGGIVYSLNRGNSLANAIQYGVACGTAATLNPGTALCKKEDADQLFSSLRIVTLI